MTDLEAIAATIPPAAPLDEHNKELLANTHPPGWVNPEPSGRYNMVVIGGGTAGLVTAAGTAALGGKVAMIERHLTGGDCLVTGCVPSKALIRSARAYAAVREAGRYAVAVNGEPTVDFAKAMERMRRERAVISHHDAVERFRRLGVEVFLGEGRFTGRDAIEVAGKTLRFAKACIATGASSAKPPVEGLEEAGYLTNETLFSLTELPARLAVIGAGPIGVEMAQTFARFGSAVTQIEMADQPLPREDRDAAEITRQALEDDGVRLLTSARVRRVRAEGGERIVEAEAAGGIEEIRVDRILTAAGKTPNVANLGLEAAGVEYGSQGVVVDDRLQTSNPKVYAAGDVCLPYQFTHAADASARIVIQNALFFGRKRASAMTIPWVTYADPEVARVGLSEREAAERGVAVDVFRVEMAEVDRAIVDAETRGFLKILVAKGKDRIVGATFVSRHAGETISEITTAMSAGIGLGKLANLIRPYPTQAEAIKAVASAYQRTKLTPFLAKLLKTVLAWRR